MNAYIQHTYYSYGLYGLAREEEERESICPGGSQSQVKPGQGDD